MNVIAAIGGRGRHGGGPGGGGGGAGGGSVGDGGGGSGGGADAESEVGEVAVRVEVVRMSAAAVVIVVVVAVAVEEAGGGGTVAVDVTDTRRAQQMVRMGLSYYIENHMRTLWGYHYFTTRPLLHKTPTVRTCVSTEPKAVSIRSRRRWSGSEAPFKKWV